MSRSIFITHTSNMADNNIFCIEHPEDIITRFCSQCDEFVCISCVIGIHNGHKISKFSTLDDFLDKTLTTTMKEDLDNLQTRFNTLKTEVEQKSSSHADKVLKLQCNIKDNTTKLKAKLEENEADILACLHDSMHPIQNLKEKISLCENIISSKHENKEFIYSTSNAIESRRLGQIKQYIVVKEVKRMSQSLQKLPSAIKIEYQPPQIINGKLLNHEFLESLENNAVTDHSIQSPSGNEQLYTDGALSKEKLIFHLMKFM